MDETTPTPAEPLSDPEPRAKASLKSLVLASVIAGALGLTVGTAIGMGASDPTASEEYAALRSELDREKEQSALWSAQAERAATEKDDALETVRLEAVRFADREKEAVAREEALDEREADLNETLALIEEREEAVGIAEKKAEAQTIREGVWVVGEDVKAGTYKLVEAYEGNMCYWEIAAAGSNGRIIDNDIVTGGRPTVTLKKGQEFKNQGCGPWRLVN